MDVYAQDLRMLFNRAYPLAQQETDEAQAVGRSVLAYQFVSGLRTKIKAKVAGTEGGFEQLLVKARFEEVKLRDLEEPVSRSGPPHLDRPLRPHVLPAQKAGLRPIGKPVGVQANKHLMDQPVTKVDLPTSVIPADPRPISLDSVNIVVRPDLARLQERVRDRIALQLLS